MKYSERYEEVIESGKYHNRTDKIKALAQLNYNNDRSQKKADCVWQALEDYEDMTGYYFDPTHEDFENIENSIF